SFHQDLNGDGVVGGTVIESFGSTSLPKIGNQYYFYDSNGTGPSLKVQGVAVTVGQYSGWALIGVEQTASGYQAAWKYGSDFYDRSGERWVRKDVLWQCSGYGRSYADTYDG